MIGRLGIVLALVLAALAVATPAHAGRGPADPDAPPGAGGQWLPFEPWVMERWMPFDEKRLYRLLDTTRPGVQRWLADERGRRSLEELARRRGMTRATLVRRLLEPWGGRVTHAQLGTLRSRTNRVLTQSHLSQHILFHRFHMWSVRDAARKKLGLSAGEWRRLRGPGGKSVAEIAHDRGVSLKTLRPPVLRAIKANYKRAVARRTMSKAQADLQFSVQKRRIRYWPLDESETKPSGRSAERAHLLCEL
jgi:transposase